MVAWPVGLILLVQLLFIILFSSQPRNVHLGDIIGNQQIVWTNGLILAQGGNVQVLGQTLYTQFLLPFEIASLVLLLAIIGAIVLSRKEEPAEVEEILPALGISLGRRSLSRSSQEDQVEKKLLPALGVTYAPDASVKEYEQAMVEQPDAIGEGTTSGVELPKEK